MIGRKFADLADVRERDSWPFKVIKSAETDKISIQMVGPNKEQHTVEVGDVCAKIFDKLKEIAKDKLSGADIKNCILTVPNAFEESQRQALVDAAGKSGLHCIGMITEPVAAALAYSHTIGA